MGCLWMNNVFRAGISAENSCEPGVLLLTLLGCYPVGYPDGFNAVREVNDVQCCCSKPNLQDHLLE